MDLVRKAIESLYHGKCTVVQRKSFFDETTKQTRLRDVKIITDEPCKLSFASTRPTVQETGASSVSQGVKLFLAPEVDIPAGSKIIVTQNGRTTTYQQSGETAIYHHHQEIKLELFTKWA